MYTAVPRQKRLDSDSAPLNARSLAIMCVALFNRASSMDVEPRDCFRPLLKEHAESLALDSENQTTCKTKAQMLENGNGEEAVSPGAPHLLLKAANRTHQGCSSFSWSPAAYTRQDRSGLEGESAEGSREPAPQVRADHVPDGAPTQDAPRPEGPAAGGNQNSGLACGKRMTVSSVVVNLGSLNSGQWEGPGEHPGFGSSTSTRYQDGERDAAWFGTLERDSQDARRYSC